MAGDVSASLSRFAATMQALARRFGRVLWTPGNHDLWAGPESPVRGVDKYQVMVEVCRKLGVVTPEDPYPRWPGAPDLRVALIFTLYDYSFRPPHVPLEQAVEWAADTGVLAVDEHYLDPHPHASRSDWCRARVGHTEQRLARTEGRLVLAGHFPLRSDLAVLPRIPRFSIWCGTTLTEHWHTRFPVEAVVFGHLHIRGTHYRDGVRFEEVSLGYPENWQVSRGIVPYLRRIL